MARFRIVFLVVSAVLLLSAGLLIWRTLQSVRNERELRHQIVAERVFDEMERELTSFLSREESRPFDAFSGSAGSNDGGDGETSSSGAEPFVVAYFVTPEGTGGIPLIEPASVHSSPIVRELLAALRAEARPVPSDRAQDPGTTLPLKKGGDQTLEDSASAMNSNTYLQELNRGVDLRQDRATKLNPSNSSNVVGRQGLDVAERADRRASTRRESFDPEPSDVKVRNVDEDENPRSISTVGDAPRAMQSMTGKRLDGRFILLSRRAFVGEITYHQGLVIDTIALVDWLSERVLEGRELRNRARVVADTTPGSSLGMNTDTSVFEYRHQFAEPFESVASRLTLSPLPETGRTGYLYPLIGLTLLAGTGGLFAIYRMVVLRMAFAERRQNFVSAVSHELKTPLTAIRMYAEMLRDGLVRDSSKKTQYYEVITGEAERLTRLVNNVLELSKLERRDRSLRPEAGRLQPVLEEARDVLAPHAFREGFEIRLDIEPDLPEAVFDRDALLQVLFNLIDNAVKYAKTATKREIVLSARRRSEELEIGVSDSGPGVEEPHLKRVFEPFYRSESEMTRESRGTGIGLALVRGLVDSMGGTVQGRNGVDGGFVVSLTLPAA